MKSEVGFPLSSVILGVGLSVSALFFLISLWLFLLENVEWFIFSLAGGLTLLFSVLGSIFYPNTLNVEILDDSIKISSKKRSTIIPISMIQNIEASISSQLQGGNYTECFKITFKEKTVFGKEIYYKTFPQFNDKFTRILKYKWLIEKRENRMNH